MKFNYKWYLKDGYPAPGVENHGSKVFGTFICGGGSSMGYKLAGYHHLGGVEIDPKVAEVYKANHNPEYLFVEDIRDFRKRTQLPKELYELDLLDGSPPCSTFSMSGSREKAWGKEKKFREGQKEQVLDDLFFEYIKLAERLKPKIVLAENVKGLILGNAKKYVKQIKSEFERTGYKVQLFLLNAATMGVPQKRERVFFICRRNDLDYKDLVLKFDEEPIVFGKIEKNGTRQKLSNALKKYWEWCKKNKEADFGKYGKNTTGKRKNFNHRIIFDDRVCDTIAASCQLTSEKEPEYLSDYEVMQIGTFPLDYNFKEQKPKYLIGMSVPPVMTAQIAYQIYLQWLKQR